MSLGFSRKSRFTPRPGGGPAGSGPAIKVFKAAMAIPVAVTVAVTGAEWREPTVRVLNPEHALGP